MKLYKYYYGICEHRICTQVIETDKRYPTGVISEDGFLYLKDHDDNLARRLFAEDEARKANACRNERMAAGYRRRIHAILSNPVLEVKIKCMKH